MNDYADVESQCANEINVELLKLICKKVGVNLPVNELEVVADLYVEKGYMQLVIDNNLKLYAEAVETIARDKGVTD